MKNTIVTLAVGALLGSLLVIGVVGAFQASARPAKKTVTALALAYNIQPLSGAEKDYSCEFTVTNIATAEVIMKPTIHSYLGTQGRVLSQNDNSGYEATCEIDEAGKTATVAVTLWKKGEQILSHTGKVQIQP